MSDKVRVIAKPLVVKRKTLNLGLALALLLVDVRKNVQTQPYRIVS